MASKSSGAAYDCGPDTHPLQNPLLQHRAAQVDDGRHFADAPRPKGDRDMDDRAIPGNG